jgi:hypothetical protein
LGVQEDPYMDRIPESVADAPALPSTPVMDDGLDAMLDAEEKRDACDTKSPPVAKAAPAPTLAAPKPEAAPEPEPELFVYGHRITEANVLEALRMRGDDALADYAAGRWSKATAYEIARDRERQRREWRL